MVQRLSNIDRNVWRQGLAFWLLLLSIVTHAVVPVGSPLHRGTGSAFSTATSDVALTPKRKQPLAEQAEIRVGDERSFKGADPTGDPTSDLLLKDLVAALPVARSSAPGPTPAMAWPEGGAASFSARAPPAV